MTFMCAAPAVIASVLEAAADWDGEIPGRDRVRIIVAGAPPPTQTIQRVEEELGWEFIQIYGLTETSPLLTVNRTRQEWDDLSPADRAAKLVRAGAPAIGVELMLDEGEVMARSNVCLDGYWDNPEESERCLAGGWFHTGDGGEIDDEGYLSIKDRKKDVIITGGENVSSIEVEDVIFSHPDVAEVAVIGVPSDKWGETIKALVVRGEGSSLTEQELIDYVKSKVARYKAPSTVEFREVLDRTATGKLQKFKLRAPVLGGPRAAGQLSQLSQLTRAGLPPYLTVSTSSQWPSGSRKYMPRPPSSWLTSPGRCAPGSAQWVSPRSSRRARTSSNSSSLTRNA